jgi:hypothetical protein
MKTAGQNHWPAEVSIFSRCEVPALGNYRGSLKFTVICVWISTGEPSSRYGLYFHCFTASAAARAKPGSPLRIFTAEMLPFFEIVASNCTGPSTRMRKAFGGYVGAIFLITSPCETPCDTFTTCNTGVGALLLLFIKFGSGPLFPAGAIPLRLGAGASLAASVLPTTGSELPLLITIGCTVVGFVGALFAATTGPAGLDASALALALLE